MKRSQTKVKQQARKRVKNSKKGRKTQRKKRKKNKAREIPFPNSVRSTLKKLQIEANFHDKCFIIPGPKEGSFMAVFNYSGWVRFENNRPFCREISEKEMFIKPYDGVFVKSHDSYYLFDINQGIFQHKLTEKTMSQWYHPRSELLNPSQGLISFHLPTDSSDYFSKFQGLDYSTLNFGKTMKVDKNESFFLLGNQGLLVIPIKKNKLPGKTFYQGFKHDSQEIFDMFNPPGFHDTYTDREPGEPDEFGFVNICELIEDFDYPRFFGYEDAEIFNEINDPKNREDMLSLQSDKIKDFDLYGQEGNEVAVVPAISRQLILFIILIEEGGIFERERLDFPVIGKREHDTGSCLSICPKGKWLAVHLMTSGVREVREEMEEEEKLASGILIYKLSDSEKQTKLVHVFDLLKFDLPYFDTLVFVGNWGQNLLLAAVKNEENHGELSKIHNFRFATNCRFLKKKEDLTFDTGMNQSRIFKGLNKTLFMTGNSQDVYQIRYSST